MNKIRKKEKINWVGYLFILPAIAFFCCYILYPIFFVGINSLYKWSTLINKEFIGLDNYFDLFKDKIFITTIKNSLVWIFVTVPVQAILGFLIAFAIEEKLAGKNESKASVSQSFFRTLFFIPVVTSVVVVAIIFSKIFQPYHGITGHYLNKLFGLNSTINILGNNNKAIFAVMLANMWEWTGWSMIMYVGGLSQIPNDIKEAAKIDGANTFQELLHIYIPSLMSVHKSLLMLGIIGSLQTYALINIMTGGGPNHATEMPGTYIFIKGFSHNQMGYACTISVLILLIALILTLLQVRFLGSGDFMKKED